MSAPRSVKPVLTPETVATAIHRLIREGKSRKLIINIGPGRIQDAWVEVREAILEASDRTGEVTP